MSLEASSEEPGIPRESLQRIDEVLRRYGWTRVSAPDPVADSVLSDNYRVETDAGPRFCRMHKKSRTIERIRAEYELLRWAGERGIPVVPPLVDPTGREVHRIGGVFVSVFPWIEGRTINPATATPDNAARLGEIHGRVTTALVAYESDWVQVNRRLPRWETNSSIEALSRIDDLIRYYPAPPEDQLRVQERIRFQLERLESKEARPLSDFDALHRQTCFGDFHERQVIFRDNGAVAAVVDWEGLCFASPTWELVRSLTVSGMLEPERLAAYVSAYARSTTSRVGEVELAVEAWWQNMLHDTWSLTTRFIQGDRRPERFFDSEAENLRLFADERFRTQLAANIRSATDR